MECSKPDSRCLRSSRHNWSDNSGGSRPCNSPSTLESRLQYEWYTSRYVQFSRKIRKCWPSMDQGSIVSPILSLILTAICCESSKLYFIRNMSEQIQSRCGQLTSEKLDRALRWLNHRPASLNSERQLCGAATEAKDVRE